MPDNEKKCIATTFLGKPCNYTATVGDYCILHAGGWDYTVANATMLWSVYGRVQAVLAVVGIGISVFGPGTMFMKPPVKGAVGPETLDLDALQKKAEKILNQLRSLAGRDDAQEEVERIGRKIIELDTEFLAFVTLMANGATSFKLVLTPPTSKRPVSQAATKQKAKQEIKQKLEEQQPS